MRKISKIYCDFDGTITKVDTVNSFFEKYANKKWLEYEARWVAGEITSQENAIQQVALIREVTPSELENFVSSIELTPYFLEFLEEIQKQGIEFTILSDGFDFFIEEVLKRNNIKNVKYFANHLVYENNKFRIEFPHHNTKCIKGAGMCKCVKINEQEYCYIGDGTSDLCVASRASLLFATKNLCKHCVTNDIKHIKFETFSDIIKNVNKINGVD